MFVSVDMDNLRILHKHHEQETLGALAWLEAPNLSVRIENTELPQFLNSLTQLELATLYRNSTGSEAPSTAVTEVGREAFLRELLAVLCIHMKPTLALLPEVEAQIGAVTEELYLGTPFKYALGAKRPARFVELFPLTAPVPTDSAVQAAILSAPKRVVAVAAAVTQAPRATPAAPGVRQRTGGAKAIVWEHADKVWEAAGKPNDVPTVLVLRKQMMDELEPKGIKRTSCSSELGNWMKARLAMA